MTSMPQYRIAVASLLLLTYGTCFARAIGSPQLGESSTALVTVTQVSPRVTTVAPYVHDVLPQVRGQITEFTVPTPSSFPAGITEGSDGNLWFVENTADNLASFNVHTHVFAEYRIPERDTQPVRIVADADGNLWFTESVTGQIGEFTIATHT